MTRRSKTNLLAESLGVLLLGVCLSACGSAHWEINSTVPKFPKILPVTVTVSPAAATVPAGATRQFTADLKNTSQGATWRVNGIPGGDQTVGTILNGLYTAPLSPPPTGRVTITAVWVGDNRTSGSAIATVVFSDASLSGQYAFSVTATTTAGDFVLSTGSFTADGNGNLTGGVKDLHRSGTVSPNLAFTGTYSVGPDGRGSATMTGSDWTWDFSLVVLSNDEARLMLREVWGNGSGVMEKQDPSDFFNSSLSGDFSFEVAGLASGQPRVAVGRFSLTGQGGVVSGVLDANQAGSISASVAFSGSYDVGVNGRGTMTLTDPSGSRQYRLYTLSADRLWLLSLDPDPAASGAAERQLLPPFDSTVLAGDYVFMDETTALLGSPSAAVATLTADGVGTISSGVMEEIEPGTGLVDRSLAGNYNISSNGRGTLPGADLVFYMISSQKAFLIDLSSAEGRSGVLEARQGAPFTTASLASSFSYRAKGLAASGERFSVQGQFLADSAGNLSGTLDANQAGTLTVGESLQGANYSVEPDGRGSLSELNGKVPSTALRVVSPSKFYFLGLDSETGAVFQGVAEDQF